MRLRRPLLGCSVLLLLTSLAACSGGGSDPDPGATKAKVSASAEAEEPEPDWLAGQDWVHEPFAAGRMAPVTMVPRPRYKEELATTEVYAAFTDDQILFADTRGNLWALDRATGAKQWRVKMVSDLDDQDTVCDLVVPSATATTVVLNHGGGDLCGHFTAYDLATGKVVDNYASVSEEGRSVGFLLADNESLWSLGERVYWLDADERLRVLEDDGSSSVVGSLPALLPAREGKAWSVGQFQVIPDTDLFLARYREPADGDFDTEVPGDRDGGLFAFRLGQEGRPELVWQRPARELTNAASSPGHAGGDIYLQDEIAGTVQDVYKKAGKKFYRLRGIEPETGELLNPGVLTPYQGRVGRPTYAQEYGQRYALSVGDNTVFSPYEVPKRNGSTSLVRYDLTTGRSTWRWQVPGALKANFPPTMDVLAMTPDRTAVYVYTSQNFENTLWEVDYETGKPLRHWNFPRKAPYLFDMGSAPTYLDGSDVFQVSSTAYEDSTMIASLFRVGS